MTSDEINAVVWPLYMQTGHWLSCGAFWVENDVMTCECGEVLWDVTFLEEAS